MGVHIGLVLKTQGGKIGVRRDHHLKLVYNTCLKKPIQGQLKKRKFLKTLWNLGKSPLYTIPMCLYLR
jgi:hypothetical protein